MSIEELKPNKEIYKEGLIHCLKFSLDMYKKDAKKLIDIMFVTDEGKMCYLGDPKIFTDRLDREQKRMDFLRGELSKLNEEEENGNNK